MDLPASASINYLPSVATKTQDKRKLGTTHTTCDMATSITPVQTHDEIATVVASHPLSGVLLAGEKDYLSQAASVYSAATSKKLLQTHAQPYAVTASQLPS